MTILKLILVFSIPLASLYLSTILILRIAFLIFLSGTLFSRILGGLFQSTLFSQSPLILMGSLPFLEELNILLSLIPIILYPNAKCNKFKVLNDNFTSINIFSKNIQYHFYHVLSPLKKDNNLEDLENNNLGELDIDFKTWLISNKPEKVYLNSKESKSLIYKENNQKSGIYLWLNNINNKYYIGSAKDLRNRIARYFSNKELTNSNYLIQRAIIKHKHENFSLYILEYCDFNDLIAREQFYLDSLTPPYNILRIAGNLLGFKHSEITLEKFSDMRKGQNHPMYGKQHSLETLAKMSIAKGGSTIYVYDTQGTLVNSFCSSRQAANFFNCGYNTILRYCKNGNLFKNNWILCTTPITIIAEN